MSVALLDVNVLIALMDERHANHDDAHRWFERNQKKGWATCPITINGVVRVLSNPAYPTAQITPVALVERLRKRLTSPDHHFWPDSVSLTDDSLFNASRIAGHHAITDAYLLGLAVRNHGLLATFDRSISIAAVKGATPASIVHIGR